MRQYNIQRRAQNHQLSKWALTAYLGPTPVGIIGDDQRMDAATIADTVTCRFASGILTKITGRIFWE